MSKGVRNTPSVANLLLVGGADVLDGSALWAGVEEPRQALPIFVG